MGKEGMLEALREKKNGRIRERKGGNREKS